MDGANKVHGGAVWGLVGMRHCGELKAFLVPGYIKQLESDCIESYRTFIYNPKAKLFDMNDLLLGKKYCILEDRMQQSFLDEDGNTHYWPFETVTAREVQLRALSKDLVSLASHILCDSVQVKLGQHMLNLYFLKNMGK